MNDFTKEELQEIEAFLSYCYMNPLISKKANMPLLMKLQKMIEIDDEKSKEIFSCHTGVAFEPRYFTKQQSPTKEDLRPAFSQLLNECDGKITESGIYAIRLQIEKLR